MVLVAAVAAMGLGGWAQPASQGSFREDHDGWIVLHLSGAPLEIGFQHGSLAAKEIGDTISAFKIDTKLKGRTWSWLRTTSHQLFWSKLDPEYRDEITAIADGARSKGVEIDADDVLALNSQIEIMDYYVPVLDARQAHTSVKSKAPLACSAFVATGSETRDGKVVMGQNFWWGYLTGEHWNVILDIKPKNGHHIMMDSAPGLIESGTDWAINDQGLGLTETTIGNFVGFDEKGVPEFQRMRKAIQYSNSLDQIADLLKAGNNGGYANTWLMVSQRSNEIGKLELGLKNVIFSTTSDGYFYGANFPESPKLMKEETPGFKPGPVPRQVRWIEHLETSKGKVDDVAAKGFLEDTYNEQNHSHDGAGGGALCSKGVGGGAINAKVVNADNLLQMSFWARMGVPDGSDLLAATQPFGGEAKGVFHDVKGQNWCIVKGK